MSECNQGCGGLFVLYGVLGIFFFSHLQKNDGKQVYCTSTDPNEYSNNSPISSLEFLYKLLKRVAFSHLPKISLCLSKAAVPCSTAPSHKMSLKDQSLAPPVQHAQDYLQMQSWLSLK